uniref:Uncharacterized protein n=1 Tax=Pectobacterium atrosepticum TaxID=29471 RepID=B8X8Z5_PECAT|nr:hypothetical protein [Pectobacterium atrosepticum]
MVNPSDRQVQNKKAPQGFERPTYFSEDLLGFNLSVFPGVFLLSRWRLSGSPVDSAMRFGPGLRLIIFILLNLRGNSTSLTGIAIAASIFNTIRSVDISLAGGSNDPTIACRSTPAPLIRRICIKFPFIVHSVFPFRLYDILLFVYQAVIVLKKANLAFPERISVEVCGAMRERSQFLYQ